MRESGVIGVWRRDIGKLGVNFRGIGGRVCGE